MSSEFDDGTPIEDGEQLVEYFRAGATSEEERGVGTEHEKFAFRGENAEMMAHCESGGIGEIFERMAEQFDWEPVEECGAVVALQGDEGSVTLEPGGQVELSGGVKSTVHETSRELDEHLEQLDAVTGEDVRFCCWGINPFWAPRDVPMVPKQRYDIMRSYLPTRGDLATTMMKTSCTVQANYDFTSEADAVDLVRTALLASPVVSAMFANSPMRRGYDTGMQSFRGHAWTDTDPDRTGWPSFMYRPDWTFEDYVDYVLDIPMFFVRRRGRLWPMIGTTFREYLESGYGRWTPTLEDFELHLSTAFPEIRLRQFVEIRGADAGPRPFVEALPALWKGILYHPPSRRRTRELFDDVDELTPQRHAKLFREVYHDGLGARAPHASVHELAVEMLEQAERGLEALAEENGHEVETEFLDPLWRVVDEDRTLADRLRSDLERVGRDRRAIVEEWSLS